jgi:hypothetical protein
MAKKKILSYEDQKFDKSKDIYASIVQAVEDVKYGEVMAGGKWNKLVENVKGLTVRLVGTERIELTYHHYEVTTVEGLARMQDDGKLFIGEALKAIKKQFKSITGKALELKEIKFDRSLEKQSQLQGERNFLLGGGGYGARPVGRYLVRDSCIYSFDSEILA